MSRYEHMMLLGMVAIIRILVIIAKVIPTDNAGRDMANWLPGLR